MIVNYSYHTEMPVYLAMCITLKCVVLPIVTFSVNKNPSKTFTPYLKKDVQYFRLTGSLLKTFY